MPSTFPDEARGHSGSESATERLRKSLEALASRDADVARAIARVGHPAPRQRPPGFATLLRIITAQQVSTKAAAAIHGRLEAAMGTSCDPAVYLALDDGPCAPVA
jgi:DNA-3-methyladenine glycosylase II